MNFRDQEAYVRIVGAADRLTELLEGSGNYQGVLDALASLEKLGVDLHDEPQLLSRKQQALAKLAE